MESYDDAIMDLCDDISTESCPAIGALAPEISHSQSLPDVFQPIMIEVKHSAMPFVINDSEDDIYTNVSTPRGAVFMANFYDFKDNCHPERPGANVDTLNIQELFSQMGYHVSDPQINLTKGKFFKAVKEFTENEILNRVDCCIIVIMSHGKCENEFITYDGRSLGIDYILESFNNVNCPALQGKPKIFIFQCCRGIMADLGTTCSGPCKIGGSLEIDAAAYGDTMQIRSTPSYTDMYIIYSSVAGFVSFRSPKRGSWLIEAICIEFMENACNADLEELMKRVSRRLKDFYSEKGRKQVCETRNIAFDKHFYFNPYKGALNSFSQIEESLPCIPPHRRIRMRHHSSRSGTPEPLLKSGSRSKIDYDPINNNSMNVEMVQAIDVPDGHTNRFYINNLKDDGIPGGAYDYHRFRKESSSEEKPLNYSKLKRQLSSATDTEAMKKCKELKEYFTINSRPEQAAVIDQMMKEIIFENKIKRQKINGINSQE